MERADRRALVAAFFIVASATGSSVLHGAAAR
jgi:hypothetical protein